MNALRRLWGRLFGAYPASSELVAVEAADSEATMARRIQEAYQVGVAHGQLQGRMALSLELESQFQSREFNAEEAALVRLRQVH